MSIADKILIEIRIAAVVPARLRDPAVHVLVEVDLVSPEPRVHPLFLQIGVPPFYVSFAGGFEELETDDLGRGPEVLVACERTASTLACGWYD